MGRRVWGPEGRVGVEVSRGWSEVEWCREGGSRFGEGGGEVGRVGEGLGSGCREYVGLGRGLFGVGEVGRGREEGRGREGWRVGVRGKGEVGLGGGRRRRVWVEA